jgi:hypothetical protein
LNRTRERGEKDEHKTANARRINKKKEERPMAVVIVRESDK